MLEMDEGPSNTDAFCLICGLHLDAKSQRTYKKQAIANLISISEKTNDSLHDKLKDKTSIILHNSCYVKYTTPKPEETTRRRKSIGSDSTTGSTSLTRSSRYFSFDFEKYCLICSEDASDDFIKKSIKVEKRKRVVIRFVQSEKLGDNIIEICGKKNIPFFQDIRSRLFGVDLVSKRARYHQSCLSKIYAKRTTTAKRGRPIDPSIDKCVQFAINYIVDNANECQFSLNTILEKYDGEKVATPYLSKKLEKYFGNDIITCTCERDILVCYRKAL